MTKNADELKLYMAISQSTPYSDVPQLIISSLLRAENQFKDNENYKLWRNSTNFKKVAISTNFKENLKIESLDNVYIDDTKRCQIICPLFDLPNVLKFSKLWKPLETENKDNSFLNQNSNGLNVYIIDEVNDYIIPNLVGHSILKFDELFIANQKYIDWKSSSDMLVNIHFVSRDDFKYLSHELDNIYLGHENHTLGGEKSCIIECF